MRVYPPSVRELPEARTNKMKRPVNADENAEFRRAPLCSRVALMRRVSGLLLLTLLISPGALSAGKEIVAPSEGLRALDVVKRAIVEHPEIHMQRAALQAARARLEERRGAFDVTLNSSVSHAHTELAILSYEQPAYLDKEALQSERTYMGSLATSMALMLEQFYHSLRAVGVSALTGDGIKNLFGAIDAAAAEHKIDYAVELAKAKAQTAPAVLRSSATYSWLRR